MESNNEKFEGKKRKADNDLTEQIKTDCGIEVREGNNNGKKDKKNRKDRKDRNKNKKGTNPEGWQEENQDEGDNQEGEKKAYEGKKFDPKKDLKSEKFENYYKIQLAPYFSNDEEFEMFVDKMREKLPCVFRINTANPYWRRFREILTDKNLIKNMLGGEDHGIKITPMYLTNSPYWADLIFNINIPRFELKRNESLTKFHKLIQKSVDAGLMSRQEAVSMIPPILMNAKPSDRIFDMCAAPGSKTAQFLEVFYREYDFLDPKTIQEDTGFVIANDNNWNRAHMMTHQLKRLNTAGMVVISHDAQHFPTIYEDSDDRILFDKILADVPCSSDAVLRKLPHKWRKWSPKDSFSLHKLQLTIIERGISLLKPGGTIVYSTCSLNPIENEAVVSEVMKSHGDELIIVDMSKTWENSSIRFRPGLTSWKVLVDDKSDSTNKNLVELKNKEDKLYLESYKDTVEESCFPPEEETARKVYQLQNCIRLFPHDSDTSGFFITVFQKKSSIVYPKDKGNKDKKVKDSVKEINLITDTPEITDWLRDYYGLDNFPFNQLVTSSKINKKLSFVSKGVANLMNSDRRNQLKLINVGVKLFKHNKQKNLGDNFYCKYRVCQDGLIYLIPFMTKRVFFCYESFFVKCLKDVHVKPEDIEDLELRESLKAEKSGCIVLMCVKNKPYKSFGFKSEYYIPYLKENYIDAICAYTSFSKLSTMINKEHQHVFNLKFNIQQD